MKRERARALEAMEAMEGFVLRAQADVNSPLTEKENLEEKLSRTQIPEVVNSDSNSNSNSNSGSQDQSNQPSSGTSTPPLSSDDEAVYDWDSNSSSSGSPRPSEPKKQIHSEDQAQDVFGSRVHIV